MPEFRYNLPKPKKSGNQPFYWLLTIVVAGLLAWLWWTSGHSPAKKKSPVITAVKPQLARKNNRPDIAPAPAEISTPPLARKPANAPFTELPPANGPTTTPPNALPPAVSPSNPNLAKPDSTTGRPVKNILEAQIALANQGISSGSLDGAIGSQTRAALMAFQKNAGLPATGDLDAVTKSNLLIDDPVFITYVVTSNDLARLQPIAPTWLGKSEQTALDYETILELVAEKGFSSPNLIRKLNPGVDWNHVVAGTSLQIPNVSYATDPGKAAFVRISLSGKVLEAFDAETNLLAHFPCSIARRVEKRPVGELHVAVVAPDPNYTFDPAIFPESPEAQSIKRKLILPPGPNNPVGVVWIGLDRPGYGMHGTPAPEQVGRTESHGCFRLANWNAQYLLRLVTIGTPVYVLE